MIQLTDVTRQFDRKYVLSNLSFTFPDRGIFALMGPSGSGKTTMLRLLAGLDMPDAGSIRSTHNKIAVAFQEPRLLPWLSCEDNLKIVLPKNKESLETARLWLQHLELTDAAKLSPKALSGGMQQRLSLARALCFGGDLLLLDEPFSALDQELKKRITPYVRAANPNGLTVFVTHSSDDATLLGAKILRLEGTPACRLQPDEASP